MELQGNTPTEAEYFNYLFEEHKSSESLFSKAKRKLKREKHGYSKSELAKELAGYKSNSTAQNFLSQLIEKGALEKAGKRQDGPAPVQLYTVNKKQLVKIYRKTDFYQKNKNIMAEALDQDGIVANLH
jgi:predicted transcriptional regulator